MSEPLRWQYAPLGSTAYRPLNCLLYAAKWISTKVCAEPAVSIPAPESRFLAPIRLTADTLARQVAVVRGRMDQVHRSLGEYLPNEAA